MDARTSFGDGFPPRMHGVAVVDRSATVLVVVGSGGCLDGGGCGGRKGVAGDLGIQLEIHWDWRVADRSSGELSDVDKGGLCFPLFYTLIISPIESLKDFTVEISPNV